MRKSASRAILELLAAENRRVLSDWRAAIFLRRASLATPPTKRRWSSAPHRIEAIHPLLNQMQQRDEIEPIPNQHRLYKVTVPYARGGPAEETEILMEVHPYAALSHLSALAFHGLTTALPQTIIATIPAARPGTMLPPGTDIADWQEFALVSGRKVDQILGHPVHWVQIQTERYFGIQQYQPHGYPVRVTTPERTLLDGLQRPELCGGLENVLLAWRQANDTLDLDTLIGDIDRLDIQVLRQRVGVILDQLGIEHAAVEQWRQHLPRGGSSKLLGSAPYAPEFSARWNLSLNAPLGALRETGV